MMFRLLPILSLLGCFPGSDGSHSGETDLLSELKNRFVSLKTFHVTYEVSRIENGTPKGDTRNLHFYADVERKEFLGIVISTSPEGQERQEYSFMKDLNLYFWGDGQEPSYIDLNQSIQEAQEESAALRRELHELLGPLPEDAPAPRPQGVAIILVLDPVDPKTGLGNLRFALGIGRPDASWFTEIRNAQKVAVEESTEAVVFRLQSERKSIGISRETGLVTSMTIDERDGTRAVVRLLDWTTDPEFPSIKKPETFRPGGGSLDLVRHRLLGAYTALKETLLEILRKSDGHLDKVRKLKLRTVCHRWARRYGKAIEDHLIRGWVRGNLYRMIDEGTSLAVLLENRKLVMDRFEKIIAQFRDAIDQQVRESLTEFVRSLTNDVANWRISEKDRAGFRERILNLFEVDRILEGRQISDHPDLREIVEQELETARKL